MKLYRYMSIDEFSKFAENGYLDDPYDEKGFCFLGETTPVINDADKTIYECNPIDCLTFLDGAISLNEVLIEFEANSDNIKTNKGTYANPSGSKLIEITEYSTDYYDNSGFKPLRYTFAVLGIDKDKIIWHEFNNSPNITDDDIDRLRDQQQEFIQDNLDIALDSIIFDMLKDLDML